MTTVKYTPREFMEMAIEEMRKSVPDPSRKDKVNPKVGAVLATTDGELLAKSHLGELRVGDHAEYTAIERKHRSSNLTGQVIYATLEPCAPGARNHPKLSCAERIFNARLSKVYIGAIDPDPTVAGEGRDFLKANDIEIAYFDKDLADIIYQENKKFFDDAKIRAKDHKHTTITPFQTILTQELQNFDITDFSEEAQQDLINRMNLNVKVGSGGFLKFLLQLGLLHQPPRSKVAKPTGLGLLVLGRNPQFEFEQARIKFTIEQSVGDAKIRDIEGPLLLMPGKAEDLLDLSFLPEINREKFHREEIIDISKQLLRELIVNAIVHRDYTIRDKQIRIVASKEKVEIWSPGEPLIGLDKFRAFEVPSISRNPKLAYIFFKSSLVEERGIGMKELKAFKDNNHLPDPSFRMEEDYFVVTVNRRKQTISGNRQILHNTESKLENTPKIIVPKIPIPKKSLLTLGKEYIQKQKSITKKQYAEHFNIDEKKAQRHLSKFLEDGTVNRVGKGPSTIYILIENQGM